MKHYEAVGKFKELEACITHLNVTSLDFHQVRNYAVVYQTVLVLQLYFVLQVMNLCWQHNLHEAVIYIHNNGMMDYVSPAEELLTQLRSALDSADGKLSHKQFDLGNKLLVYISCCLAGRAFPHGDIPKDRVAQVWILLLFHTTCTN